MLLPLRKQLATGSFNKSIKLYSFNMEAWLKNIDDAHASRGGVRSVSYSPNGRILVSAGNYFTMKIWDAETFDLKHTFKLEFRIGQLTINNFINWKSEHTTLETQETSLINLDYNLR